MIQFCLHPFCVEFVLVTLSSRSSRFIYLQFWSVSRAFVFTFFRRSKDGLDRFVTTSSDSSQKNDKENRCTIETSSVLTWFDVFCFVDSRHLQILSSTNSTVSALGLPLAVAGKRSLSWRDSFGVRYRIPDTMVLAFTSESSWKTLVLP